MLRPALGLFKRPGPEGVHPALPCDRSVHLPIDQPQDGHLPVVKAQVANVRVIGPAVAVGKHGPAWGRGVSGAWIRRPIELVATWLVKLGVQPEGSLQGMV